MREGRVVRHPTFLLKHLNITVDMPKSFDHSGQHDRNYGYLPCHGTRSSSMEGSVISHQLKCLQYCSIEDSYR